MISRLPILDGPLLLERLGDDVDTLAELLESPCGKEFDTEGPGTAGDGEMLVKGVMTDRGIPGSDGARWRR